MKKEENKVEAINEKPVCGIIMPISSIDNCSMEHWAEVKKIISEAICDAGYKPNLVSNADDIGIIQKRIIQNIYDNDIVVCDVSGKNPNVMFELGMRLAFDKPAIIVIDDKTDYSFDTSPIEHLSYPRDLRYYNILNFKEQLKTKIIATVEKAKNDPNYTTFLKNFGEFEVAHVEKKEGSMNEVLLSKIEEMAYHLSRMERRINTRENVMVSTLENEKIKSIIHSGIGQFCKEKDVPYRALKEDPSFFADRLFTYLEENEELRRLCKSPETLRSYLDIVLSFF
ncbi:hypothetical protein [Prevotella sp. lc2012]|uniref:hypothetical protein n=1 Tax=Prevotella sp. lc2012 TaxID=1761886 RepID=UPI000897286E|nr:hypothetical protein [Prevotella sp. lc2012]SEE42760.1 hypothetical protein SAMN04487828_1592 [Prevotella sp. lc2012]